MGATYKMDSSSSSMAQAYSNNEQHEQTEIVTDMDPGNNEQPEQTEIVTDMDPDLYAASREGKIDAFKDYKETLDHLVTPNGNTVLHVHFTSKYASPDFVEQILDKCPSLLKQANSKGEIPLHIAAREGLSSIVNSLIRRAKAQNEDLESGEAARKMLRMTSKSKNTSLHEAIRHNHCDVLQILIKEDPEFSYSANDSGETPLYMAASRGYQNLAVQILACPSAAHGGPNGRTALHGAVMSSDAAIVKQILEKRGSLAKEADQNGWTPLHYAADFGHTNIVKFILDSDKSAAYIGDKYRKKTALHMAASQRFMSVMQMIISKCPGCSELVDNRGWNVLHYIVASYAGEELENLPKKSVKELRLLLENPLFTNLTNEKDVKGNTPLHLIVASCPFMLQFITKSRNDMMALNKRNHSVSDIYSAPKSSKIKMEIQELMYDVDSGPIMQIYGTTKLDDVDPIEIEPSRESHLIVAILIATVTFTAAFTLPGGYKDDKDPKEKGTAILLRTTAFQAFIIANAIAMVLSISAVFLHFLLAMVRQQENKEWLYQFAFFFITFAMGAMVVAFITGSYAVLGPSLGLAIATCFIGLSFFLYVLYVLRIFF